MSIIVQKYGGSSVADLEKIRRVARKIIARKRQGHDLVVVVSAMGDTTDELLDMARQLAPEPSRRELDMLLSVGERISMALLSMAIHQEGYEAISLTGSQCGIITTDSHSNARIMDVRPFRVQDELRKGHIVIVAGYQGTSYKREVTTLGRGGSDTTAVALAAALSAAACEIYSDVDGVYSADPRVVLGARQLAELSYEEMIEMARGGASVLNEQAVAFARDAGISLYARSTHLEESKGTVIRPDGFLERAERAERGLPHMAVSHTRDAMLVSVRGAQADVVLGRLEALGPVAFSWAPGESARVLLNAALLAGPDALAAELEGMGASVERLASVSLVGQGVGAMPRWAREAHVVIEAQGVEPGAPFCASARLTWPLPLDALEGVATALHGAFVFEY